jgi:hypothetical protein
MTVESPISWAEFLVENEALKAYYAKHNIKCFMCCAAEKETFAVGAKVHEGGRFGGFNAEKVVEDLNSLAKEHPYDPSKVVKPSLLRKLLDLLFPSEKKT